MYVLPINALPAAFSLVTNMSDPPVNVAELGVTLVPPLWVVLYAEGLVGKLVEAVAPKITNSPAALVTKL